jgi:mannose-6-phosphate isomerase-like protein (cupin superfamily)
VGAAENFGKALAFLHRRKVNYQLTFSTHSIATRIRQAYRQSFGHYAGQAVLIDLAKFCRADETTFHPEQDIRTMAILEGRRQVFLRITQHMRLTPDELFAISAGQNFPAKLTGDEDG